MKETQMLLLSAILLSALLLGCGGENPQTNGTTGQNTGQVVANNTSANNTPVTIIIGEQKNQTAEQNKTEIEIPVEEGPKKALEYTDDPGLPLGIYFIYVGDTGLHGDAILIKKGDFDMLVDAGPAEKASKVVDFLKSKGVDDIEILVSTNADPRRYGGINAVADNFGIERYWWTGLGFDDQEYEAIAVRMEDNTKGIDVVGEGYKAEFDGMTFTVLNPSATKFVDVNNDAAVMRLDNGNFSILFTSDIQTGAQGGLINREPALIRTQVLEAPYYGVGAGTANIGVFLTKAKPQTVIISGSADESAVNGGSRDPFRRLMNMSQNNITWYENYRNGTIRLETNGENYTVMSLGK